jgi:hypothetical protein
MKQGDAMDMLQCLDRNSPRHYDTDTFKSIVCEGMTFSLGIWGFIAIYNWTNILLMIIPN